MLLPFFHILLRGKIALDDLVLYPILPTLFHHLLQIPIRTSRDRYLEYARHHVPYTAWSFLVDIC
jgi:hypothetical protein